MFHHTLHILSSFKSAILDLRISTHNVSACVIVIVLEYAEHGDLFASWCCTPNRQVPLEITRLYSAEIALALGTIQCIEPMYVKCSQLYTLQISCIPDVSFIGI